MATCPCKLLPRSLSSFTAAEYGDIHSLSKIKDVASRRDDAGYNPIHYAAQFNHVAATAFLLQLGCPVDGGGHCGATPLHRASFSGATAAMKVLLEWNNNTQTNSTHLPVAARNEGSSLSDHTNYYKSDNNASERCNLLAKDTSYGDESTPLHKAAAGGRYLAVHMILEALRDRDAESPPVETSQGPHASRATTWLQNGLSARDKNGRTPLDVAQQFYKFRDTEKDAVARWDAVAGGLPDWGKCAQLLRNASSDDHGDNNDDEDARKNSSNGCNLRDRGSIMTQQETIVNSGGVHRYDPSIDNKRSRRLPRLPLHLTRGIMGCLDCDRSSSSGGNALCLTAKWQTDFQEALGASASMCIFASPDVTTTAAASSVTRGCNSKLEKTQRRNKTQTTADMNTDLEDKKVATVDSTCPRCQKSTVAFYPLPGVGTLVCKRCRRLRK